MKPKLLLTSLVLLACTGCSSLLLRQTCVGLARDVNYCLAPLPVPVKSLQETPQQQKQGVKPPSAPVQGAPVKAPSAPQPKAQSHTQQVSIEIDGKRHELLSQVELDDQHLSVVGLAPLGQPLFEISFDGHRLVSEQSMLLGDNFRAEYLVALMQLIYWPSEDINATLSGGDLMESSLDMSLQRTVSTPEGNIINIDYSHPDPWQAKVLLTIPSARLTLRITPLA